MFPDVMSGRRAAVRPLLLGLAMTMSACLTAGEAAAEPPIQSSQDAYCRNEARNRVFAAPDPQNVGLHEVGRRIYQGCMRRYGRGSARRGHRHYRRRHRR